MAEMSLELQKQKMLEMKGMLDRFCNLLNTTMDDLNNKVIELRMQGLPVETAVTYLQGYYMPERTKTDELVKSIFNEHFDYIDRVVNDIDEALNKR